MHVLPATPRSADMAVPDPARRERLCAALAELACAYDVVLAKQRRGHRARRAATTPDSRNRC